MKNSKKSEAKLKKVSENKIAKDSNAAPEGVKYRVTSLVGQSFRGKYYKEGEIFYLSETDAKAYARRSTLLIELVR